MKNIIILIIFTLLSDLKLNAQKEFTSSKNTITIANGSNTTVTNEKKIFFDVYLKTSDATQNNIGHFWLSDTKIGPGQPHWNYFEEFRIYNVSLKDDGTYYYWSVDIGNDGQTVLFHVDMNSAIPTITMSRYAPTKETKVLKQVIYYLD